MHCGREKSFLCRSVPVPSANAAAFDERPASDMNRSQAFPWSVTSAVFLIGDRAGDAGTRIRFKCELGFSFKLAATVLLGSELVPVAGAEVLRLGSSQVCS